ncbi:hypothetical protein ACFZDK_50000 [Streptomyces sp. NPDC007901]
MTVVMVELTRKPEPVVLDAEDIVLVTDVDELTESTVPGCGDDNPYN